MKLKVKTKFNLRDNVWYMSRNRPQTNNITYIFITVTGPDQYSVSYDLHYSSWKTEEEVLFSTKEELLNSL